MKKDSLNTWIKSGTPWIWMNAGAVSIAVIMTLGLLAVIAVRGLEHFWPSDVVVADYQIPGAEPRVMAGEVVQVEEVPRARLAASGLPVDVEGGEFMTRELLKVGNREVYGADFSWVVGEWLSNQRKPADLVALDCRHASGARARGRGRGADPRPVMPTRAHESRNLLPNRCRRWLIALWA